MTCGSLCETPSRRISTTVAMLTALDLRRALIVLIVCCAWRASGTDVRTDREGGEIALAKGYSLAVESDLERRSMCASRMVFSLSACDFKNRQRLEWNYGEDDAERCGDDAPTEPTILKCDHVAWWSGEGVVIMILAAAGMGISLFFWLGLSKYRTSRTVRLGQPAFCMAFVAGIGISCVASLALLGENTNFSCSLRLWMWSAGFDLAFGAMAVKLWRALSVVESSLKFRRVTLTSRKIQTFLILLLFGDVAILISWTASIGGLQRTAHAIEGSTQEVPRYSCTSCCHSLFFIWVSFKAVMVLFCCYMSYRTRKIQACMAESGAIALATYNMGVAGLLVAAVFWADADAQVRITSEAVAIVLVGVGALCTIIAPKLLVAREELENKALIGPCSGPGSSDGEGEIASCVGIARPRGRTGRVGGGGVGGSNACIGDDLMAGVDCDGPGDGGSIGASIFAVIPGSTGRKRTPARGAAAPVVPVGMLATPRIRPLSSTSVGPKTPMWGRGDREGGTGGGGGGGKEVKRGRPLPLASAFCTPPPRVRRSRSAGANGGSSGENRARNKHGIFLSTGGITHIGNGRKFVVKKDRKLLAAASFLNERRNGNTKPPLSSSTSDHGRSNRRPVGKGAGRKSDGAGRSSRQGGGSGSVVNRAGNTTPAAGTSSASGSGTDQPRSGQASVSRHMTQDSWPLDPITFAMNGEHEALYRGGGTGGSGSTTASAVTQESRISKQSKQSKYSHLGAFSAARRTLKRRASSGSVRSGRWRHRERTISSVSSGSKAGVVRRSSAAGSLKMFADSGTRLFCPHCEQEVAGCGFKGCSGSLVRAPSFSDEEGNSYTRRASIPMPVPPLRRPLYTSGGDREGGRLDGSGATTTNRSVASLSGGSAATTVGVSSTASAIGASGSALSPLARPHRLRMSFRRGRSACDTFDNEDDSTEDEEMGRRGRSSRTASPQGWLVS